MSIYKRYLFAFILHSSRSGEKDEQQQSDRQRNEWYWLTHWIRRERERERQRYLNRNKREENSAEGKRNGCRYWHHHLLKVFSLFLNESAKKFYYQYSVSFSGRRFRLSFLRDHRSKKLAANECIPDFYSFWSPLRRREHRQCPIQGCRTSVRVKYVPRTDNEVKWLEEVEQGKPW